MGQLPKMMHDVEMKMMIACGDCESCDCHEEDDSDMETIAIRNYIENKHENGEEPTLKQIQSRMKGYELTCGEIYDIVLDIGYDFVGDDDTPRSQWKVATF